MGAAINIAMIGYGAIGQAIGASLTALGEAARLRAVLVREGRSAGPFNAVHDAEGLAQSGAQIVMECAGHNAVRDYGPALLSAGLDLILTSTGACADPAVLDSLRQAEAQAETKGGGRLLMAPGAVGGLDGLLAARLGGLDDVTYISAKPPHAWRGTAAEERIDLAAPDEEQTIFEGSARQAAQLFPKNANVAISVALCGLGPDKTSVRLVSSRAVTDPLGVIEANGACGRFKFESYAYAAPDNPKTSLLTAYSLLQCARLGLGVPISDLLKGFEP